MWFKAAKKPLSLDIYFVSFSFLASSFIVAWYGCKAVMLFIWKLTSIIILKNPSLSALEAITRIEILDWSIYLISFFILPGLYLFFLGIFSKLEAHFSTKVSPAILSLHTIAHFVYWALVCTGAYLFRDTLNDFYFLIGAILFFLVFTLLPLKLIKVIKKDTLDSHFDTLESLKHRMLPYLILYIIILFTNSSKGPL